MTNTMPASSSDATTSTLRTGSSDVLRLGILTTACVMRTLHAKLVPKMAIGRHARMEMSILTRIRIAGCCPYLGRVCRQLGSNSASLNNLGQYAGGLTGNCGWLDGANGVDIESFELGTGLLVVAAGAFMWPACNVQAPTIDYTAHTDGLTTLTNPMKPHSMMKPTTQSNLTRLDSGQIDNILE